MVSKDNLRDIGIGLGIGLVVGGILGILYAPKKGSETRKQIRDASGRFAGKTKTVVSKVASDVRARFNKATIEDIKKR